MDFLKNAWKFLQYYILVAWDFCVDCALAVGDFFARIADKIRDVWQRFMDTKFAQKMAPIMGKTGQVLALTCKWAYKLRGVLLSIPVAVAAVFMALRNQQRLPDPVGISILPDGTYQWTIEQSLAVWVPLAVTGVCLLMVICSKRVLYPWLISLFSLVLPLVLWITNVFPN